MVDSSANQAGRYRFSHAASAKEPGRLAPSRSAALVACLSPAERYEPHVARPALPTPSPSTSECDSASVAGCKQP